MSERPAVDVCDLPGPAVADGARSKLDAEISLASESPEARDAVGDESSRLVRCIPPNLDLSGAPNQRQGADQFTVNGKDLDLDI